METTEKLIEKTPNGGDYSIAYFFDENNIPTIKEKAVIVRICEYTNDGKRVMETYATIQK